MAAWCSRRQLFLPSRMTRPPWEVRTLTPVTHSQQFGWAGSVRRFLETPREIWLNALRGHHCRSLGDEPASSQVRAWLECFDEMTTQLRQVVAGIQDALQWGVIFEYELPRERGRRPDVTILASHSFVVLEFKGHFQPKTAFVDQAAAYVRDLKAYHAASHELHGTAVLVLMGAADAPIRQGGVVVMGRGHISTILIEWARGPGHDGVTAEVLEDWLQADYAPLPTLVSAARCIFNHEPLPSIRRAQSAGIPDTIRSLSAIAHHARDCGEHHLALITGVPGAGKTLVGLQFVYNTHFTGDDKEKLAVFLSGNGPLVKVLQHALKSQIFVQDIHGFLRQYGGEKRRLPIERIWVYDEAQRAWDGDRVREKRGHGASEPEDFVRIAARMGGWSMIVGLIGEGQEIYIGEEAGLAQWNDAITGSDVPWHVHCPGRLTSVFNGAVSVEGNASLDLDVSLRSHVAEDVQEWIECLLCGSLDAARAHAAKAKEAGFQLYVSRVKEQVVDYAKCRYEGEPDKRYGWVASSKASNLAEQGINNSFVYARRFREGPWFNDPPQSAHSCCQLTEVATEFQCQGLELDLPILAWGDDLTWEGAKWRSKPFRRSKAKDPHQLRMNSYRVLLSRGRDGLIVFVPPDTVLDSTFEALMDAGLVSP